MNKCLFILFVLVFVTLGCDFPHNGGNGYYQGGQSGYQPYSNPQPAYVPQPANHPPAAPEHQPREHTCPTCGGTGKLICPTCHGRLYLNVPCGSCQGTGRIVFQGTNQPCPMCRGTGKTRCSTCMYIDVPQGTIQCQRCTGTGKITR